MNNKFRIGKSITYWKMPACRRGRATGNWKLSRGFTLVELLVVMAILGVLVTIGLVSFRSSQMRGRDAQRKSDLKQLSNSLELFYSDYAKYPSEVGGLIQGCPYNPVTGSGGNCTWGASEFTDGRTIYFKNIPVDASGFSYLYRIVDPPLNQKYQLFAFLENTEDPACIAGNCSSPPVTHLCGGTKICNFAITSPNVTATE
jgi:general secretion pathway protein G